MIAETDDITDIKLDSVGDFFSPSGMCTTRASV